MFVLARTQPYPFQQRTVYAKLSLGLDLSVFAPTCTCSSQSIRDENDFRVRDL